MKAIIMAGGSGSRLRPLTCDLPKPLAPVANKPVMAYAVELLREMGITEIGVTLQYLPDAIRDYFGDGSEWGVTLHYFVEDSPLGTAGSVKNAQKFLDESFLVVSGDALTDFELQKAVDFHRSKKALATQALTKVTAPLEYGVVITRDDGKITRFLEKPRWSQVFSDQVNTGIYVLEPEVLDWIPDGAMYDFSKDLFPRLLAEDEALYGCSLTGYWCDIGDLDQYRQAHYDLMDGKLKVRMPYAEVEKGVWLAETADIEPGVKLEPPVIIGEGCRIESGSAVGPYSVLGTNTVLSESANSKKSIIWQDCQLGQGAQTRGAVLCDRVRMSPWSQALEGAAIGKDCVLQYRSLVKPGVKLWPEKIVDEGLTLKQSIIWGNAGKKRLFGQEGVSGLLNLELTPELALRLGLAYGSVERKGSRLAVSCDSSQAAGLLKKAFSAGLASSGINVADLGTLALPVHRFASRAMELSGVHLKRCSDDREKVCFTFVDHRGINISPARERKIENLYHREEFRRAVMKEIGKTQYIPGFNQDYVRYLLQNLDVQRITNRRWRLAVQYGESLQHVFPEIMEALGCEMINLNLALEREAENFNHYEQEAEKLSRYVFEHGAELGLVIDDNGEKILIVDGKGNTINSEKSYLVLAGIMLLNNPGSSVAVPVTEPDSIERLADKTGGSVERTAVTPFAILEKAEELGSEYRQSWLQFDGVHTILRLMELMSKKDWDLEQFLRQLPEAYMDSRTTHCPWEFKGRVMRSLIEEEQNGSRRLELTDGIKVYHDQGWALVLPHAESPQYKVLAQGYSQEAAEELTDFYLKKIARIIEDK